MPRPKSSYKCTYKEYLEIKRENKRKLDIILANPNYQEELGKKYYGINWMSTLYGNHPLLKERRKKTAQNAIDRMNGKDVPLKVTWNRIPIVQLDLDGNLIKEWESARKYCEENGYSIQKGQTICNCARGLANTAYNYKWKFKEDYDKEE